MKLSEAMRLGAMLGPQAFNATRANGATCALGAALSAIGRPAAVYIFASDYFPVCRRVARHPVDGDEACVLSVIRELNDFHGWTREQIADWVETLESAEQPALEEATPVDEVRGSLDNLSLSTRV